MENDIKLQSLISKLQEKEKQELIKFLNEYLEEKKTYGSQRNYFLVNPLLID